MKNISLKIFNNIITKFELFQENFTTITLYYMKRIINVMKCLKSKRNKSKN